MHSPSVDRFSRLGWWYSERRATPGVAHLGDPARQHSSSCQGEGKAGDNPTTEYSGSHGDTNMRDTFFDRTMARGSRIALVGGLIGFLAVACSDKPADSTGDDPGTAGTDTSPGAGGDAQGSAGSANPTTGTGGQAAAGSTGSGGATGKAGAGGGGGSDVIVDAGPRVGPLKIMALGDSTTEFSCFRAELAKLLDESHPEGLPVRRHQADDFGGCGGYVYDKHNQGMSAYLVTKTSGTMMNTQAEAPTWAALKPDVRLLHFATNDAWNSIAPDKILAAWTYLVGEFRKANPRDHDPGGPGDSARPDGRRWRTLLPRLPHQRHDFECCDSRLGDGPQHRRVTDHRRRSVDGYLPLPIAARPEGATAYTPAHRLGEDGRQVGREARAAVLTTDWRTW